MGLMDKMYTKVEEIDKQVEHGNRLEIILCQTTNKNPFVGS